MTWRGAGVLLLAAACQVPDPPATLHRAVQQRLLGCDGTVAVYFRDLQTGQRLQVATRHVFQGASAARLLVAAKVHRDVADGRYALADEVPVHALFASAAGGEFRTAAQAPAVREAIGRSLAVGELLHWMVAAGDDLATNLLIERAGGALAVTEHARACGLRETTLERYLMDVAAAAKGLSSRVQPREVGELLEKVHRGELPGSAAMLESMAQAGPGWLGAALPPGATIARATAAAAAGPRHDAGIVWVTPQRAFVAGVFAEGQVDERQAEKAIAAVARVLWDYVAEQPPP